MCRSVRWGTVLMVVLSQVVGAWPSILKKDTLVRPRLDRGDPVWVACSTDGAPVYAEMSADSRIVRTAAWMAPFVALDQPTDKAGEWVPVGEYVRLDAAKPVGWMRVDDLLMSQEAKKTEGIYEKAIVVVHYDRKTKTVGGAVARVAPNATAKPSGPELTLFSIFQIYDERLDPESDDSYLLLGEDPTVFDPMRPGNTIRGWVSSRRVFHWNTREAAEYDKATLGGRKPVRIYEKERELRDVLTGKVASKDLEALAEEDPEKKEVLHDEPRFPIISRERKTGDTRYWNVGFVADEIGPTLAKREEVAVLTRLPNVVDILFVFDGTGSMRRYRHEVLGAVQEVVASARQYWRDNYPGEKEAELRFSVAMYKDYTEKDCFKRLPLERDSLTQIETFIEDHRFSGGRNRPAVFHAIVSSLAAAKKEFRKESFRAVFLIGDMGNMGVSNKPDPGPTGRLKPVGAKEVKDQPFYTTASVLTALQENDCDFYVIHTAGRRRQDAYVRLREDAETIGNAMRGGISEYIPLTEPHAVQRELAKKITQLLDERYQMPEVLSSISQGRIILNRNQITGTRLLQRAVTIMERYNIDPQILAGRSVSLFAEGWAAPVDVATGQRALKLSLLMDKQEVEGLITFLGQAAKVSHRNVQQGWCKALEAVTGDRVEIDPKVGVPAEVLEKHLGIPVRSGVLHMTLDEVSRLPYSKIAEAIRGFQRKLFLLRAVVNEKAIKLENNAKGEVTFEVLGDRKYWFGARGAERAWLDAEIYMP